MASDETLRTVLIGQDNAMSGINGALDTVRGVPSPRSVHLCLALTMTERGPGVPSEPFGIWSPALPLALFAASQRPGMELTVLRCTTNQFHPIEALNNVMSDMDLGDQPRSTGTSALSAAWRRAFGRRGTDVAVWDARRRLRAAYDNMVERPTADALNLATRLMLTAEATPGPTHPLLIILNASGASRHFDNDGSLVRQLNTAFALAMAASDRPFLLAQMVDPMADIVTIDPAAATYPESDPACVSIVAKPVLGTPEQARNALLAWLNDEKITLADPRIADAIIAPSYAPGFSRPVGDVEWEVASQLMNGVHAGRRRLAGDPATKNDAFILTAADFRITDLSHGVQ